MRRTDGGGRAGHLTIAVAKSGRRARPSGPAGRKRRRRGRADLTGEAGPTVMRPETVGAVFEGGFNINSFGVETEGRSRLRLRGADSG